MTQILAKMNAATITPDLLEAALAAAMPRINSRQSGTKQQAFAVRDVASFVSTHGEVGPDDIDLCLALCARIFAVQRWANDNAALVPLFSAEELLECAAAEELIDRDGAPLFSNEGFRRRLERHAVPLLS